MAANHSSQDNPGPSHSKGSSTGGGTPIQSTLEYWVRSIGGEGGLQPIVQAAYERGGRVFNDSLEARRVTVFDTNGTC